jgi:hypothetical protein
VHGHGREYEHVLSSTPTRTSMATKTVDVISDTA